METFILDTIVYLNEIKSEGVLNRIPSLLKKN